MQSKIFALFYQSFPICYYIISKLSISIVLLLINLICLICHSHIKASDVAATQSEYIMYIYFQDSFLIGDNQTLKIVPHHLLRCLLFPNRPPHHIELIVIDFLAFSYSINCLNNSSRGRCGDSRK